MCEAREYANVPKMAMPDPMTVLRSMASWKTTEETTIMMTRLAVFNTEEVTAPTWLVKAKATMGGKKRTSEI